MRGEFKLNLKLQEYQMPIGHSYKNIKFEVPQQCPHCNRSVSPKYVAITNLEYSNTHKVDFLLLECPDLNCGKQFITTHLRELSNNSTTFYSCYPSSIARQFHELIHELSPRFVNVYNQAYAAEQLNLEDVAGAGYRKALEILIKDFAIKDLNLPQEEVVKKSLANCIKEYLPVRDAQISADVVRVIGNDYVHYDAKYEDVDLSTLNWYLDYFIATVESELRLLHPPVKITAPAGKQN